MKRCSQAPMRAPPGAAASAILLSVARAPGLPRAVGAFAAASGTFSATLQVCTGMSARSGSDRRLCAPSCSSRKGPDVAGVASAGFLSFKTGSG
jgi:hypothetical protein